MSLEKDISQSSFRNDFQKGIINLIYTYNWMNEKMKSVFDKEGITGQQYNILRILRGAGKPISTLQIRERMLDKMSDTSRIVDRLVIKGLVKKATCPTDKRLVDVNITDKGQKLLKKLDASADGMYKAMDNLTEKDAEMLSLLLDKLRSGE